MSLVHASAEAKQSKQKVMNGMQFEFILINYVTWFSIHELAYHNSSKNPSHFQTESDEFEQFFENADFFGNIPWYILCSCILSSTNITTCSFFSTRLLLYRQASNQSYNWRYLFLFTELLNFAVEQFRIQLDDMRSTFFNKNFLKNFVFLKYIFYFLLYFFRWQHEYDERWNKVQKTNKGIISKHGAGASLFFKKFERVAYS